MEKNFKTISQQIEILKNKNLKINNIDMAKNILENNNYYYLINGYKNLFIDYSSKEEKFIEQFNYFYKSLIKNINELKKHIKAIKFTKILNKMGFPNNYRKLLYL